MEHLTKVVWSEGMYLAPHHFQAQSSLFERSVHFAVSALWSNVYGLSVCEMNKEGLNSGVVSVLRAEGIFPDGLPFQMPGSDFLPTHRQLKEVFDPARDSITVLLAIAPRKTGEPVIAPSSASPAAPEPATARPTPESKKDNAASRHAAANARYIAEDYSLCDENTGRDGKTVRLGRKNIRLLFDFEVEQQDVVSIPIARVVRRLSGQLEYDPHFVPPCLRIDASERLRSLLKNIIGALEDKSKILMKTRSEESQTIAQYAAREIAEFWYLHTVNSGIAGLRHLSAKRGHAEELFLELSRLAGALCTFLIGSSPQSLPLYNHRDSTSCFEQLETHITEGLQLLFPRNWAAVKLSLVSECYYSGAITNEQWLGPSQWIFGIQTAASDSETILRTPNSVRICSAEFIQRLVNSARRGLELTHLPTAPTTIPTKLEWKYFEISKHGPCWDHIVETRKVGIHIPSELPSPEIVLFIAFNDGGSVS